MDFEQAPEEIKQPTAEELFAARSTEFKSQFVMNKDQAKDRKL